MGNDEMGEGMQKDNRTRSFSRRRFIQGAAAITAAGALAGCSPVMEGMTAADSKTSPDTLFGVTCAGNCAGACYLNAHVRDGQLVRTTARDLPDGRFTRMCVKGATHVGRVYSSKRVLYPMRRIGERGSGEFERISWDEAIDEICKNWKAITDELGSAGFGIMFGSGNYSLANGTHMAGAITRLRNVTGASELPQDTDAGVGPGYSRAHGLGIIGLVNKIQDRKNSKTIVFWGINPAQSMPHLMHWIMEAKEQGSRLVVIDPIYSASASKADWWIPVKAGTDGALALGMINAMLDKGWIAEETLRDLSNAPFLVKEDGSFLRGSDVGMEPVKGDPDPMTGGETTVDVIMMYDASQDKLVPYTEAKEPVFTGVTEVEGIKVTTVYDNIMEHLKDYTPEKAAEMCGVPAEDIVELARVYCEEGPVCTEAAFGLNHYRNAHYNTWPQALVVMLSQNYGKPGAGLGWTENFGGIMLSNFGVTMPTDSKGNPCLGTPRTIHANSILDVIQNGSHNDDGIGLKGVLIYGFNPASTNAEHERTLEWLKALDFVVTSDMYMTETMMWSDVILPSPHWFEKEDVGAYIAGSHDYLTFNEKALEPLGEAIPDVDALGLIAKGLGYGDFWVEDTQAYIKEAMDSPAFQAMGITFEKLKEEGTAYLNPAEQFVASVPATGLETGRFYLQHELPPVPDYNVGQELPAETELLPQFIEGAFMGEHTDYRKEHPFHVMSERMRTRTHSQWSDCDYVREYEPEPAGKFNPDDCAELGLAEGGYARLSNTFGEVVVKVHVNAGVPPKTVVVGRSWNQEDFKAGHFNSLCSADYNPYIANQAFNDAACKVEKA